MNRRLSNNYSQRLQSIAVTWLEPSDWLRKEDLYEPLDSMEAPIVYEFVRITRYFDLDKPLEFINSGLAYEWVKANPSLLKYKPIRKESVEIKEMKKKMNSSY